MIRKVYLYGDLAEKFGKVHELAGDSIADVIGVLQANYSNFKKSIIHGRYAILRGESIDNYDDNLTEDQVTQRFRDGDWHIIPEAVGAGGIFQFIAGAVLTIAGAWTGQTWLIQLGVGLMLTGVATMLSPVPDISDASQEEVDERASFIYNGGVNNIEQGGPVPLCYGRILAGSVLVSSDVQVNEIAGYTVGSSGTVTPPLEP